MIHKIGLPSRIGSPSFAPYMEGDLRDASAPVKSRDMIGSRRFGDYSSKNDNMKKTGRLKVRPSIFDISEAIRKESRIFDPI